MPARPQSPKGRFLKKLFGNVRWGTGALLEEAVFLHLLSLLLFFSPPAGVRFPH